MFLRSIGREPAGETPRVADISDAGIDETRLRRTQQLVEWRRSARRVTQAWNAWLAAETRDGGVRYGAFVAALAGEESAAAELERTIDLAKEGRCVNPIDARKSGAGAW